MVSEDQRILCLDKGSHSWKLFNVSDSREGVLVINRCLDHLGVNGWVCNEKDLTI
jgi:hypothetical protein